MKLPTGKLQFWEWNSPLLMPAKYLCFIYSNLIQLTINLRYKTNRIRTSKDMSSIPPCAVIYSLGESPEYGILRTTGKARCWGMYSIYPGLTGDYWPLQGPFGPAQFGQRVAESFVRSCYSVCFEYCYYCYMYSYISIESHK
jgi:hypothetical protein